MDVYVILNLITLIIACFVCIYSFKLVLCLNTSIESNWWGVMPIAFLWATINRFFVLLTSMDVLNLNDWLEPVAAGQIIFWILILVIKVGFYRELKRNVCPPVNDCGMR